MPHEEVDTTSQQPLAVLVGCQLSSVEFVHDYLQLRFDGPCLTVVTHPTVRVGSRWFAWEKPGYRDTLCERIGKRVSTASVVEGQGICIKFEDTSCIALSLRPEDYRAAEAAMFDNGYEDWWVW